MERKEFLNALGVSAASLFLATCLGGCSKSGDAAGMGNNPPPPSNIDFTLDLNQPDNSNLGTNGGFIYKNGVIVARTTSGSYIAVAMACTHQGTTVVFDGANNRFFCNNHGSSFSTTGAVNNGPASTNLKQYSTTLTGRMLRVFG